MSKSARFGRNKPNHITQIKERKLRKIIVAAAFFAAFSAIAGPLGLNKGMTLNELKKQGAFVSGSQQFVYTAKTITSGHPDFESYTVILTPEQGLCKIQAVSKDIDTSSFGNELQGKYRELVGALSKKYGAPGKDFDFLMAGSIWKEPQYWMMGLLKKERNLDAFWSKPENNDLPDSLGSVALNTYALSGSKGFIKLIYDFDNIDACMEVLKSKKNSSL
jgi:hypothetical protein